MAAIKWLQFSLFYTFCLGIVILSKYFYRNIVFMYHNSIKQNTIYIKLYSGDSVFNRKQSNLQPHW